MNEESEPFEERLRRQPVKPVPAAWRAEILAAAKNAPATAGAPRNIRQSFFAARRHQFLNLLWPHPKVWAGLAAAWVFILLLNVSMRDPSSAPLLAQKAVPASPEVIAQLRLQQKMLAELTGQTDVRVADRQRNLSPKPRSDRTEFLIG